MAIEERLGAPVMILSFTWTTPPLLAGVKTMTWRDWTEDYADRVRRAGRVAAWDRLPRAHGHFLGRSLRLLEVTKGTTADMQDSDYEAEGLAWMAANPESCPKTIFGKPFLPLYVSREYFDHRRHDAEPGYIVRFLNPWAAVHP